MTTTEFKGIPDPKTLIIQSRAERQKFISQAPVKPKKPLDPLEPFEDQIWRGITTWTNVTDVKNPFSTRSTVTIPAKHIRKSTIENWTKQLTDAGYFVKHEPKILTISLEEL